MSFLDARHPLWEANIDKWMYAYDHYTGEYVDRENILTDNMNTSVHGRIRFYLHRKAQAETEEAYEERLQLADPVLLFPTAVDSLNGILFSKSEETEREWGDFGDPEEPGSVANMLWHNADGKGTNWLPLMKQVGIKQTVMHRVWGLVDGIKEDDEGTIKIIHPASVVNWFPTHGQPTQVLVKESHDTRSSIEDKEGFNAETYVLYGLDGWTRLARTEQGEEIIDSGEYAYYATERRDKKILPIFPVDIPMPRDIGLLLAMKQNHIFNFKSIRDFAVRNTSFSWLQFVGSYEQYTEAIEEVKKGFRIMRSDPESPRDHSYMAPPSDHLQAAGEILETDKEDFMESAFRSYGDAARQVTATEIRQESRSGVEAFLTLLVSSVDEFENNCYWRLEQVYFPDNPSKWGNAYVKRSSNFQPEDIKEALEKASQTVWNADRAGAISTRRKVEMLNPSWTDEQVDEEVQRIQSEAGALPLPPNMIGV